MYVVIANSVVSGTNIGAVRLSWNRCLKHFRLRVQILKLILTHVGFVNPEYIELSTYKQLKLCIAFVPSLAFVYLLYSTVEEKITSLKNFTSKTLLPATTRFKNITFHYYSAQKHYFPLLLGNGWSCQEVSVCRLRNVFFLPKLESEMHWKGTRTAFYTSLPWSSLARNSFWCLRVLDFFVIILKLFRLAWYRYM